MMSNESLNSTPENSTTLYFLMFICLQLREREKEQVNAQVGEGQRETQNVKQAPGSELSEQSPMRGSNSRTVRS